jgi:hypothetical protein
MKTLKIINNRLNWLSAGFLLAMAFIAWLEDDKKKDAKWNRIPSSPGTEAYEPSDEFMNIYNHYNNKETTNA